MTAVSFSSVFNATQLFTSSGLPLAGGLLNSYAAGTSTPLQTYTTSAGSITGTNPIVLGSDGRPPTEIWLLSGSAYKFVLTDSLSNVLGTYDNVSGIVTNGALTGVTNLTMSGNLSVGGTATVTGNETVNGALTVVGQTSLQSVAATDFSASAQPSFQAYRNTAQTIVTSGQLIFDKETFDKASNYSISTGIFTAPSNGTYLICVNIVVQNLGVAPDVFFLSLSGTPISCSVETDTIPANAVRPLTIATITNLASGTMVSVDGVGGNWGLVIAANGGGAANRSCVFSMAKIS